MTKKTRAAFFLGAVATLILALSPSAASAEAPACNLIGAKKIGAVVGLPHRHFIRAGSSAQGSLGADPGALFSSDHSVCDLGLWKGTAPESHAQLLERAKVGDAAQIGFSTWVPDGPNASDWETEGFAETVTRFRRTRFRAVRKLQRIVTALEVSSEGHAAIGALFRTPGQRRGLEIAVGCWSDKNTSKIVCIVDAEAVDDHVVAHLNSLAAKVVPTFLGSPGPSRSPRAG